MKTAEVGQRVYDVADPRHIGIIRSLMHWPKGTTTTILWEETGWWSLMVPVKSLRKAPRKKGGNKELFEVKRALAARRRY